MLGRIADEMLRGIETAAATVGGVLHDPAIRLGVTGLARAGKTVFITSLVANLLERGRMQGLRGVANGAVRAVWLQPQPDDAVPRFAYEDHLAALTGPAPRWPESTRAVSQLRLSFRVMPQGPLGGIGGARIVHLDIVDYPGEWLLDLGLMEQTHARWSAGVLAAARPRPEAAGFLRALAEADPSAPLSEPVAQALTRAYVAYLEAARAAGYSDCTPGRFLMPGDLAGSPALTFVPMAGSDRAPRGSLGREMARRFEAYKTRVAQPFFRDHFARIDRQVVLVDLLEAVHAGPAALADLRGALARTLGAFRPGPAGWLGRMLGRRRVSRLLFAATRADHLHHSQHARLAALLEALLSEARDRARFSGAEVHSLALAALRATVEETRVIRGQEVGLVRGRLLPDGRQVALHPGDLPADPRRLLSAMQTGAQTGAPGWPEGDYALMRFAPAVVALAPGDGPPHLRLDQAAEFLFGDRLT